MLTKLEIELSGKYRTPQALLRALGLDEKSIRKAARDQTVPPDSVRGERKLGFGWDDEKLNDIIGGIYRELRARGDLSEDDVRTACDSIRHALGSSLRRGTSSITPDEKESDVLDPAKALRVGDRDFMTDEEARGHAPYCGDQARDSAMTGFERRYGQDAMRIGSSEHAPGRAAEPSSEPAPDRSRRQLALDRTPSYSQDFNTRFPNNIGQPV
jgi:hypothetical protein